MVMRPGVGVIKGLAGGLAAAAGVTLLSTMGWAGMGQPSPKQIKFQDAATPIAEQVHWFHDYVNTIIVLITLFVLALMLFTMWRFSEKRNPVPSKTSHNTTIEVIWTVVPVLILVAIAIPSFRLLYNQYTYPPPDLVIKATAHTWNWTHEYPDQKITIDSVMLQKSEIDDLVKSGFPERQAPRNLAVDNEILVPVNKVVHVLITSSDVIHNWTIPSFASKVDAVPGRVTATWFKALREGIFFGQCSELCGKDHAFMPIAVRVVKEQVYNDWIAALKARDKKKAKDIIKAAAIELEGAIKTADSGAIVKK